MISHSEIRKGVRIIIDGQPYEVLESMPMKKAQRRVVIQSRIKNLITGTVMDNNFHQGDMFQEAEIKKVNIKFLYANRGKYVFCYENDPSKRFEFTQEQIGNTSKFLRSNQIVEGLVFEEKIININLPIKVNLKVTQASPGIKGDSAQGANKTVTLETGAEITVPLFIKEGDILEINTEKGEYVRRITD